MLNPEAIPDPAEIHVPATKSSVTDPHPSRRAVLAGMVGFAASGLATGAAALAPADGSLIILHDGWVLRADDLARLDLA